MPVRMQIGTSSSVVLQGDHRAISYLYKNKYICCLEYLADKHMSSNYPGSKRHSGPPYICIDVDKVTARFITTYPEPGVPWLVATSFSHIWGYPDLTWATSGANLTCNILGYPDLQPHMAATSGTTLTYPEQYLEGPWLATTSGATLICSHNLSYHDLQPQLGLLWLAATFGATLSQSHSKEDHNTDTTRITQI